MVMITTAEGFVYKPIIIMIKPKCGTAALCTDNDNL